MKIDRAHFRVHFREHWKISRERWKIFRENSRGSLRGTLYWPRGSTGVQRYGCIPQSAANNLEEIPQKLGLQTPCFEEFLGGGNVLGLVPAGLPHTLGYACTFYAPTSPPPTLEGFTQTKPQPSWAFPWTSSCTLSCAFSWALSWESSWVKFRGSRALCLSDFSCLSRPFPFCLFRFSPVSGRPAQHQKTQEKGLWILRCPLICQTPIFRNSCQAIFRVLLPSWNSSSGNGWRVNTQRVKTSENCSDCQSSAKISKISRNTLKSSKS